MTVVVSTGPPTSAPQPGASSGASGETGGVFAALFGALTLGGDPPATPDAAAASALNLLQGMLPATAKGSPMLGGATSESGDNAQAKDNAASTDAPPPTLLPLVALITGLAQPAEQDTSTVAAPATPPETVSDETPTNTSKPAAADSAVLNTAGGGAVNLPLPDTGADPTGDQSQAPARQTASAGQNAQPPANTPPPSAALPVDDSVLAALAEDAPADPADPQPHATKKAVASAVSSTSAGKVAGDNGGTASAATATPPSGITLAATATPDPLMLPLSGNPDAPLKTVPVSSLAGLSQQAAVTAIGAAIATEANGGTNRFIIRLDPPDLGRIDVRLHFDRDGELRARLVADRPDTVNLLTRDAGALERALNASGVRTADAGIDVSLRDSSGGFARSDGTFGNDAPPPYSTPAGATAGDTLASNAFIWVRPQSAAGRLDLTV